MIEFSRIRNFSALIRGWILLPVMAGTAIAQQPGTVTWADGNPFFSRAYITEGVRIDSLVELLKMPAVFNEPDSFQLHLAGIDRTYQLGDQADLILEDFNRLPDADLYLLTDAFGRKVRIIRPGDGTQIGEFGGAPNTEEALERPVAGRAYLDRGTRKVVVSDQGSHRILVFDYTTQVLEFKYGTGTPGAAPGELSEPSAAAPVPDSSQIYICDTGNNRILLIAVPSGAILWEWGQGILLRPSDVELTADGVLVADKGNNRVLRVDRTTKSIVWQFGSGAAARSDSTLNAPEDAQLLPDGSVLIADRGNNRLVQVNADKRIVWQFLSPLPGLKSIDRLAGGKTLVISNNRAIRLGYATQTLLSTVKDLGKRANFDSLRWDAQTPPGTGIRFQIRAAASIGDLEAAPWLGPEGPGSYYIPGRQLINPANDGNSFFQYRVELSTNDPLLTPILNDVLVFHHFFETQKPGSITSPAIHDSAGQIIVAWNELRVHTSLPASPAQRNAISIELRLLDANTGELLWSDVVNSSASETVFILSDIARLKTVQSVKLQARLATSNSAISPVLEDWQISWRNTASSKSSILFTDAAGAPANYVRAFAAAEAGPNPDAVIFISLRDANLRDIQNSVDVSLQSAISGDRETVTLELKPSGAYILSPGLPGVIQTFVAPGNGFMEMADRDTLVVQYQDPTSPQDVASASALVLQFTTGTLNITDRAGTPLDIVSLGDSLFLRISGERDRDFSAQQDTIFADLFDTSIRDIERVMLLELPSAGQIYATGDFYSRGGIPITRAFSTGGDGRLQTQPGGEIRALYSDNERLEKAVKVRPDSTSPTPISINGAFEFLVGPNPFLASGTDRFRLRICAGTGDLSLKRVDIYNVAGDKIRTLAADQLGLDSGPLVLRGTCGFSNNWWDLKTENGLPASSGTYWARFIADFTEGTGQTSEIQSMRKLVLIR